MRQGHIFAMKNLIDVYRSIMDEVKGELLFTKSYDVRTSQGSLKEGKNR